MGKFRYSHALALLLFLMLGLNLFLFKQQTPLPEINGVILPEAKTLEPFRLVNHNNLDFSNADLLGRWHLLAYGYTDCPDVCPTTLSVLNKFDIILQKNEGLSDTKILFYTIDPERDTVKRLAQYLPFFNAKFTGLTRRLALGYAHQPFEQGLGLLAELTPVASELAHGIKNYTVAHGYTLYVINPKGKLQAVLQPQSSDDGERLFFTEQKIYTDYRAIRHYIASR